ncbi:MAG: hypothetical protein AB8H03_19275 [Saprospiraceae bacterium]
MSKLFKLSFLFAIIALLMTSCNNDNPLQDNNVTPDPPVVTQNQQQISSLVTSDSSGCYEIVFPIIFIMDDGTSVTLDSELDLDDVFAAPPFPVDLGFPVNLTDPVTGENVTANDEAELATFLANCDFGPGPGVGICDSLDIQFGFIGCYDLEYPVSFELQDGSTATANSVDELATIFTNSNPPVDFVYPLNLTNIDTGDSATANSEAELEDLLLLCDGFVGGGIGTGGGICDSTNIDFGFIGCYDLVYPVSFELQDGSTATANSVDDLSTIFTNSNPPVDFAYPLNLTNIDTGAPATANSEAELEDLLLLCGNFGGGGSGGGNWGQSVVYPMTIITAGSDTTGFPGCYDFIYPVSIVDVDGNVLIASDDNSMIQIVFGATEIEDFVYPVNVTETSTGQTLTANNEGDVIMWLDDCN